MRHLLYISVVLLSGCLAGTVSAQMPEELYETGYAEEVDLQVEILTSAYQLDEATQAELKEELYRRGKAEREYDLQMHQDLLVIAESGDNDLLMQRMAELVAAAPLNEDRMAEWVEERVPPQVVAQGRPRFEELKERRSHIMMAREADMSERAGAKATRVKSRVQRNAEVDSRLGTPMPRGRKGQQIARNIDDRRSRVAGEVQRPNLPKPVKRTAAEARPKIDRGKSDRKPQAADKGSKQQDAPYAKAPPLDEWDKHVASIADKYDFTEAQVTKAQSILRDLRRRAYQYRTSRALEYERAEKLEDKAKRDAQLKHLDKAIDAMFGELKQRLECLPTMQQRQKAGAGKSR